MIFRLSWRSRAQNPAPLIALVGADGSGKSTVSNALLEWLEEYQPTSLCHLGKQTGAWGRAIGRLPILGRSLDRAIVGHASKVRQEKGAGPLTSVIIFTLSMRRVVRFARMRLLHSRGIAVLTDRYPQAVVPGPMDGPGLVARHPKGWLPRFLTRKEQGLYDWMASYTPDLVIRLNVDLPTALRRKPDHRPASLERKIRDAKVLSFNGAPILDLDSRWPLDVVIGCAQDAIRPILQHGKQSTSERR